ncbi:acetyltransferase (GNAT) family protein [Jatrophihabitans sp. GAS493]|uniref:GNAT family N-acetyltransferase n=1 Tax=Jatrophihabitans sp. GAS493 TaxID=1907575 RepID=UPI000BB85DD8|nr:GNAT family N-acetyltransferase [Jatrophihabitans sp. GAS493]SOD71050.1 acetyltransferase (GNAT) family protein [Jatrophihabitans sp. GAS493]
MPDPNWIVTDLRPTDHDTWQRLYTGYCDFYEVPANAEKLDRVWGWLNDPTHEVNGIVVRRHEDAPASGLAHYRAFARPLHGAIGCYLDDLFVAPQDRGSGAVDALLAQLRHLARTNGWDVVRWITSDTNIRARTAYDRVATATNLITYNMSPQE